MRDTVALSSVYRLLGFRLGIIRIFRSDNVTIRNDE